MSSALARRTVRGMLWSFLALGSRRLITLASLVALARLLAPEHFGVVAFALVFITYVETLGDLGTGAALIYWESRREDAAQVTFFFNLVMGFVWFALASLAAAPVADFFHSPEGAPILRAMALSFVIKGLGNTHDALCRKDLRFKARLVPEAAFATVKGVVAVALAALGWGAWSLVWGQLVGLGTWTLLLWLVQPFRPRLALPTDLVRPMLAYGRGIVAVNVLAAVVHHADLLIVGRMLGVATLGVYQMATKIPELTITTVVSTTSKVLFPAFAKLQSESGRLGAAYLTVLRSMALLTVPAAATLVLVARPLVEVLLGEAWLEAVPILRALAVYACLRSLGSHAGDLLKATGRPGLLAGLGVLKAGLLLPVLLLAARRGAVAVAWAMAGVTLVILLLNLLVASRLVDLRARQLLEALRPGLLVGGAVALALAGWLTLSPELGDVVLLLNSLTLGAAVYLVALHRLAPEVYTSLRDVLLGDSGHARPAPAARRG